MTIILYGISNCDTVKKARNWLQQHDIDYQFHDFRKNGLSAEQVAEWIDRLGLDTLINKRGTTWRQLDDSTKADLNESTAVNLILANPALIKRPLLIKEQELICGFAAANYTSVFGI